MTRSHTFFRALVLGGLAMLTLAGCDALRRDRGDPAFDGHYFRAKASGDETDARNFTVSVRRPQQSLTGAREAALYQANKYCIEYFGNSEKTWTQGPDSPNGQMVFAQNGDLLVAGTCAGW